MIIGGTSGIGLALARHFLEQGARVAVCGRAVARVDPALPARHADLHLYEFDITDREALGAALDDFAGGAIDMLIVTAGAYADAATIQRDPACGPRMVRTNIGGLQQAFELASQKMLARGSGHLVAVASVAGLLRDYPGASLYSATKRGVIAICDAYRLALAPFSVAVTAIVPGYIDTAKLRELNGGDASGKPFLLSEQAAVRHIVAALARRQARCVFPWQMHWLIKAFNCLPQSLRRVRKK